MSSFFSSNVDVFRVSDAAFARAYDALGGRRRGVLKKWISQLYVFWGRERALCRTQTLHWDQGLVTHEDTRPLDWVVFVLSPTFSSPAQLMAAVLPAMLAGVSRIAVVREQEDAPFPDALLAVMELAGQELVLEMSASSIQEMTEKMFRKNRRGKVCFLGGAPLLKGLLGCVPAGAFLGLSPSGTRAGIWFKPGVQWALTTLAWSLPDTVFYAGGDIPKNACLEMKPFVGSFRDFLAQDFNALYLPLPVADVSSPCVFGPGQEGGWIWPDLGTWAFMDTRVVWQSETVDHKEVDHGFE